MSNAVVDELETIDTTTDSESKWQDMPMDLFVHILALANDDRTVVVASGVCTGWRNSISTGINQLSFDWCQQKHLSDLVQSVARKFSRVKNCSIRRCSQYLTDDAIRAMGAHWHDLRALDLTRCTDISDISHIARGCSFLEKLDLSGCVNVSEAGLVVLARQCQHLRHLNLCGCYYATTDAVLMGLAQNCSGLQYLNVGWCAQITDVGVTALALGCRDLRSVDFCGCVQITDESVIHLADNCRRLRVLSFCGCCNLTDAAMYTLVGINKVRKETGLRSIKRSRSSMVSHTRVRDDRYYATFYSSTNSSINTKAGTGFDTSYLRDSAGVGLMSLNLSGCTALSAHAVQTLCYAFPQLHSCPDRRSLIISGCLRLTTVHCICVAEARLRWPATRATHPLQQPFRI